MSNNKNIDVKSNAEIEIAALEQLLIKSRGTDIPTLLQAKELAKAAVRKDASSANLAALQRANSMLKSAERAMTEQKDNVLRVFKNTGEVLLYLQEDKARQLKKSKLYDDIKKGLLPKKNRAFRQIDVDRYAGSLPLSSTPDGRNNAAEERLKRREEADIRIKEAQAEREEKKNKIIDGQYINREEVYQELAARAVALNTGLKSVVQAEALDLIRAVGGDQQKTDLLAREMDRIIDEACNEYSRTIVFDVNLQGLEEQDESNAE